MSILIIDIGSSSARALLFDETGCAIDGAHSAHAHHPQAPQEGAAVFDPIALRQAVESCIDAVLQHPASDNITAVGITTFAGNLLALDSHDQPLTPLWTYADTRATSDAAKLAQQLDEAAAHQRTGCPFHAAYAPAQILAIRRLTPDAAARAVLWCDFATYLYRCWLGDAPMSRSLASWSGLLNRHSGEWDAEILATIGLDEQHLPPLADYGTPQQGLLPVYARRWPQLAQAPFFLALGDGAAATIGAGVVDDAHLALTVGTTAAIRRLSTAVQPVPAGLWSYRIGRGLYVSGGATSEGGNVYAWAQRTLQLPDDVEQALQTRPPTSHGLTALPLFAGERSPGWQSNMRAALYGIGLETTPLDILHALLEGVALRLATIADLLDPAGTAEVYAGGGALIASPAWAQIMANALNRPLHLVDEAEVTARGVAGLVLKALGYTVSPMPRIHMRLTPDAKAAHALAAARKRQQALYNWLRTS